MIRMRQSLKLTVAAVMTGALLAGCGATIKQADEAAEMNPRVEAAVAAFGPGFDYMIIETDSALADAMFVGVFKPGQVSDLSRRLHKQIFESWSQGKRFMVTGARSRKTAHVIIEALSLAPDDSLTDLELLYLGDQEFVQGIEESVRRVGGTLKSAPYPG